MLHGIRIAELGYSCYGGLQNEPDNSPSCDCGDPWIGLLVGTRRRLCGIRLFDERQRLVVLLLRSGLEGWLFDRAAIVFVLQGFGD